MKINIHTSHPSAFISSTFTDLKDERKAVATVLRKSNLNINALDIKPASNDSSKKEIMTGIKESDFLVLIVGERYGSIIPPMTGSLTHSITRWEYLLAAKRFNKDVLVYFKKVTSHDAIDYDDKQSGDFIKKGNLLAQFKKELSVSHNPKYFSTPDELAEEVKKALIPIYRSGVKTLVIKHESLLKENETLKEENQRLRNATQPPKDNATTIMLSGGLGLQRPTADIAGGIGLLTQIPHYVSERKEDSGIGGPLTQIPVRAGLSGLTDTKNKK